MPEDQICRHCDRKLGDHSFPSRGCPGKGEYPEPLPGKRGDVARLEPARLYWLERSTTFEAKP
jgi:hypothetical protein